MSRLFKVYMHDHVLPLGTYALHNALARTKILAICFEAKLDIYIYIYICMRPQILIFFFLKF